MADTITLFAREQLGDLMTELLRRDFPVRVKITKASRTLSQNALYWQWLTVMAAHFTERGHRLTKGDAHDLMRHKFLGHETKTVGQTEITKLRSTTELDKGEMTDYMTQIDNWCVDHGCLLPKPEDSEYQQIMREMGEVA